MDFSLLNNKKILITQSSLRSIGGSEVVTLELAEFFQSLNMDVTVFTWFLDEPMESEFKKRKIYVTTDNFDKKLSKFDYVWVHHQVLPIRFLQQIHQHNKIPYIIFNHMSATDDLYIEQPYIYDLEKKIASLNVFVSKEALQLQTTKYPTIFQNPIIFPNPFPEKFLRKSTLSQNVKKVLIVSNHPPEELKIACQELINEGIEIDFLGRNEDSYEVVSPSLIQKYDAIVTIGKTVQYCLAANKPVYIYDHFGGCGYLNSKNYQTAKHYNFSGRGFKKKTVEQIKKELIQNYYDAQKYQSNNYNKYTQVFSLPNNINNIIKHLPKNPPVINFDKEYLNYLTTSEGIVFQKIISDNNNANRSLMIDKLNKELIIKNNQALELSKEISQLNQVIHSMQNSRTVKLINRLHKTTKLTKQSLSNLLIRPEIIVVMCLYNEQRNIDGCLKHLEPYVDKIVIFDDASTDNTISIAKNHKKVIKIIKNDNKKEWNERKNREQVIKAAFDVSKKKNVWILCVDADERFETRFLRKLRSISKKYSNTNKYISVHFRELWDNYNQFRVDGIWNTKKKDIFFPLTQKMTFNYPQKHHFEWHYRELDGNEIMLDYNLYHLKMIKPEDRITRAALYNQLDPDKSMQKIGYDYLTKTDGLKLKTISKEKTYDTSTISDYYKS